MAVQAQSYSIDWHTMEGGGGTSSGSGYILNGAFGQPDGGATLSGGGYTLESGFSGILAADAPVSGSVIIFDNSTGSFNGGAGITATTWLASRFRPGPEPWQLDSVSLLLNSQDSSGGAGPPSIVNLRIYASDPVSGKPSVNTGPVMELADGRTNPVTLVRGQELVKWIPSTPFILLAETSYWAVFSAQNGVRIGQIASFTQPTGAAGVFGASVSTDAGTTWGTPIPAVNQKMLIKGTALPAPPESVLTTVSLSGEELRFGFPASAGRGYVIESREDLTAGAWADVPGTSRTGDGTALQVVIPDAFTQSQQFYRVRQLP